MRNLIMLMLLFIGAQMSAQFKSVPISNWNDLKSENAILVDVRTVQEFEQGHLCEAKNLDYKATDFKVKIQELPKDSIIYVYCKTGVRSENAATLLTKLGYRNVVNLEGGFNAFTELGGTPCLTN